MQRIRNTLTTNGCFQSNYCRLDNDKMIRSTHCSTIWHPNIGYLVTWWIGTTSQQPIGLFSLDQVWLQKLLSMKTSSSKLLHMHCIDKHVKSWTSWKFRLRSSTKNIHDILPTLEERDSLNHNKILFPPVVSLYHGQTTRQLAKNMQINPNKKLKFGSDSNSTLFQQPKTATTHDLSNPPKKSPMGTWQLPLQL